MNEATLAVAGSRKTQSIVDTCSAVEDNRRRLVLTYTINGQRDVERRLRAACQMNPPEVQGWYGFLLSHFVRPYLPLLFPERRLRGLNFEGEPPAGRFAKGAARFLDAGSRAYKLHLSKLAFDVARASGGAVVDRLEGIFDEIHIDEVQDLTGYDLDVVEQLLRSRIDIRMVGDVRQSVYTTNPRDPRNKKYRSLDMLSWFEKQEKAGMLSLSYSSETWRSNQAIATFSDALFPDRAFPSTTSRQTAVSGHDGVFAIAPAHVASYIELFNPFCLRQSKSTATPGGVGAANFGLSKGLTYARVLIFPTSKIRDFILRGAALADQSACGLYVAVTRATHSVAFVLESPESSALTVWRPPEARP